jgi:hypothetical protein
MSLVGGWASARIHERARARLRAIDNGSARGVLARGRLSTARLDMLAFALFGAAGFWSIVQGPESIALREPIRFAIIGGLLVEVAVRIIANRRDDRIQRMLAREERARET